MCDSFKRHWLNKNNSQMWADYLDSLEGKRAGFRQLWHMRHIHKRYNPNTYSILRERIRGLRDFTWNSFKERREAAIMAL